MFRRAGRELHQVEAGWSPGGTLAPTSSQLHPFLFGHFSIDFVSEMVLTCTVSIYIICKYGNGEIFTHSEKGKWVKASLMLVNRTRRRKKFLELAIWEVFTEGNAA